MLKVYVSISGKAYIINKRIDAYTINQASSGYPWTFALIPRWRVNQVWV